MTQDNRQGYRLRPRADSRRGAYFDICVIGDDHVVGTVLVASGAGDRLEVVHPAYFYRLDGRVIDAQESALLAWLSDLAAVNAALSQVGAPAVQRVAWHESVSVG